MEDRLLEALKEDYMEMCRETKTEFDEDRFEEYLDKLFQSMSDIFMEVNNDSSI